MQRAGHRNQETSLARGITEEDVHKAADAIVGRGERPTIERIRAELGRGSPNTVNRHLDAWWAQLSKRISPQTDDLPGEIVELARKVWQQVFPKATELAEIRLGEAANDISARNHRLTQAEAALDLERRQFAEARIALDRRIGELETMLLARDQAIAEAERTQKGQAAELKAAWKDTKTAEASLIKAQTHHAAEISKLQERLAGTEQRLMDRLVEEKTARSQSDAAARRRIKRLEEELRASRKLLGDQTAAAMKLQASVGSELDALRKSLVDQRRAYVTRTAKRVISAKKSKNNRH